MVNNNKIPQWTGTANLFWLSRNQHYCVLLLHLRLRSTEGSYPHSLLCHQRPASTYRQGCSSRVAGTTWTKLSPICSCFGKVPLPITESASSWGKRDNAKLEHSILPEYETESLITFFWYAEDLLEVFQRNFEEGD